MVRERLLAGRRADDRVGLPVARPRRSRRTAASTCASSSTTRRTGLFIAVLPRRRPRRAGRETRNSVRPGADSTSISASLWLTRRRTMSRPRPVPLPTGLVVKNGSKMRSRISAGMPGPLSTTRTTTRWRSQLAVTSTRPESGTASSALSIRFAQIWLSSPAKPRTRGRSGSTVTVTATDFARAFALSTATVLPRLDVRSTGSATVAWSMCVNPLIAATRPEIRLAASWISEAIAANRAAGGRPAEDRVERRSTDRRARSDRAPRASPAVSASGPATRGVDAVIREPVGDGVLALGLLDRRQHAVRRARRGRTTRTASMAASCASVSCATRPARASPARRPPAVPRAARRRVRSPTPGCSARGPVRPTACRARPSSRRAGRST